MKNGKKTWQGEKLHLEQIERTAWLQLIEYVILYINSTESEWERERLKWKKKESSFIYYTVTDISIQLLSVRCFSLCASIVCSASMQNTDTRDNKIIYLLTHTKRPRQKLNANRKEIAKKTYSRKKNQSKRE